jgi:HEAT repeat protein
VEAWLAANHVEVMMLLELAAASPSPDLREAASAVQERVSRRLDEESGPFDERTVTELLALIDAHVEDGTVLTDLVEVLAGARVPAALEHLTRLTAHPEWMTRMFAVKGLGELGEAVGEILRTLATDDHAPVRAAPVHALERFGGPRAWAPRCYAPPSPIPGSRPASTVSRSPPAARCARSTTARRSRS